MYCLFKKFLQKLKVLKNSFQKKHFIPMPICIKYDTEVYDVFFRLGIQSEVQYYPGTNECII
jgi:hypothetical protein